MERGLVGGEGEPWGYPKWRERRVEDEKGKAEKGEDQEREEVGEDQERRGGEGRRGEQW